MESTKGSQSEDEDESEEEEEEEEEEGEEEGDEKGEREEVEGGVGAGSDDEESEQEDEERDGSARGSGSDPIGHKVESKLSVQEIREKAANEGYKRRAREKQKYHSRRGAERIGRAKGSKGKQDNRVKLDKGGLWD
jgi:RIO kinase 2